MTQLVGALGHSLPRRSPDLPASSGWAHRGRRGCWGVDRREDASTDQVAPAWVSSSALTHSVDSQEHGNVRYRAYASDSRLIVSALDRERLQAIVADRNITPVALVFRRIQKIQGGDGV
jgi:hypothetical protein